MYKRQGLHQVPHKGWYDCRRIRHRSFLAGFSNRREAYPDVYKRQALMSIMAAAQLADEPAARNSKRLPVKANGEVRLRSVEMCIRDRY